MAQEYRVGLFWKMIYGLIMAGIALLLINLIATRAQDNKSVYIFILSPAIMLFALFINLIIRKVVITNTAIIYKNIFRNKRVAIVDILGYRAKQKYVSLETNSGEKLIIRNFNDYYRSEDLFKWIKGNFTDLDKIEYAAREKMMLQDESIGDSEPERKENIDKAKLEALGYNLFGFMMPFIAIVAQQSYVMVFIGIACPVGGLYILSRSQHIVKFFNEGDKSSYPAIGFGFMFLVASVLMAALIDNHVLNFLPILFPALLIAVVLFIFLYKNGLDRSVKNINTQIAAIAITSMAYGFGLNVLVNQVFDYSKPVMYQSSVIDAYITKGKGGTHYYFKIAAWPGQIENQSESVTRQQYLSLPLGTSVEVYQKKGLFHAPWYYVVLPETTPPAPAGSGNGNSPGPR